MWSHSYWWLIFIIFVIFFTRYGIQLRWILVSRWPFYLRASPPFQQMYGRKRPLLVRLKQNPCQRPLLSTLFFCSRPAISSNLPSLISSIIDRYTSSLNSSSISLVSNHVARSFWSNSGWLYDLSSKSCAPPCGILRALAPRQRAANTATAHQYNNLQSMIYQLVSDGCEETAGDMLMTRTRRSDDTKYRKLSNYYSKHTNPVQEQLKIHLGVRVEEGSGQSRVSLGLGEELPGRGRVQLSRRSLGRQNRSSGSQQCLLETKFIPFAR